MYTEIPWTNGSRRNLTTIQNGPGSSPYTNDSANEKGRRLVSMTCKSALCLKCNTVYVDNWVSQLSKMLHEGIINRYIVLTILENLRLN